MPEITFRKATREDAPFCLSLEQHTWPGMYAKSADLARVERKLASDEAFIIESSGQAIGTTSYRMKGPDHGYLSGLIVEPSFRSNGIARLAAEFRLSKLENVRRVDLVTHPRNSAIIRLYLSLGFFLESWKEDYFGDGQPRVTLARELPREAA